MRAAHFLLGEPDLYGLLAYAVIFLVSAGGFAFVVVFIYIKVFRPRGQAVTSIGLGKRGGADEKRREG